jgi:magnesium chelatase subunit H
VPFRFVIVTLDAHLAGAFESARAMLRREMPALELSLHVQAEWDADPAAVERCRADIARANVIACVQLFTEEMAAPILDAVKARREAADAVFCALCTSELTKQTRLGKFSMLGGEDRSPFSPISLLKKLRGSREDGKSSGERQMTALRRLPKLLKFVPGTAQDVRAYFVTIQYWLGGTDANVANMVRYHVDRYASGPRAVYRGKLKVAEPETYPEVGVWHPELPGRGLAEDAAQLPGARAARRPARWACSSGGRTCSPATCGTTPRWSAPSRRAACASSPCSPRRSTRAPRWSATSGCARTASSGAASAPSSTRW